MDNHEQEEAGMLQIIVFHHTFVTQLQSCSIQLLHTFMVSQLVSLANLISTFIPNRG